MQDFNQLLQHVAQQMGLHEKAKEFGVLHVWKVVVPKAFESQTRADSLYKKGNAYFLRVKVRTPSLASELAFELEDLLTKINAYTPQTGIHLAGIELRVGW
jgi:hypothetical protein